MKIRVLVDVFKGRYVPISNALGLWIAEVQNISLQRPTAEGGTLKGVVGNV